MARVRKICTGRSIDHYEQRHKPYSAHVILADKDNIEIYYQKDGYPMLYAFGIPNECWNIAEAFEVGWKYIYDNKGVIDYKCP